MNEILQQKVREFILDDHPCVMAQSVFMDDTVEVKDYGTMNSPETISELLADLKVYVDAQDPESKDFNSFIAVFKQDPFSSEIIFEKALWKLLADLWEEDNSEWDPTTSPDPENPEFSYSLHKTSFYIVGMHPKSSRLARRAPYAMVVFNLHHQFELLRSIHRYDRVRNLIRRRDQKLQGTINPMLEDFGTRSEARQYSGRAVTEHWQCPYKFSKS
jgi:FPC/CPF motif-containing protein YcgG